MVGCSDIDNTIEFYGHRTSYQSSVKQPLILFRDVLLFSFMGEKKILALTKVSNTDLAIFYNKTHKCCTHYAEISEAGYQNLLCPYQNKY